MSQIIPHTDTFTEEATHLGDVHSGYARLVAWTSDSASGDSIACAAGNLHNGYFQGGGVVQVGTTGRFAAAQHASAGDSDLLAFVWRPFYSVRARARLSFRWRRVSGSATVDSFRRAAVGVRLQSHGSYSNTAGAESVTGGSGYWLVCRNVASQPGAKFYLLRVVSGATTKLAESSVVDVSTLGLGSGLTMYLLASNSGGNAILRCRRSAIGRETLDGTSEVDIFTGGDVTDSSGSKILSAGRCGFGITRPPSGSVTVADWFEIMDPNTGGVVLRDEWLRANYLVGAATSADANGKVGRSLLPAFSGSVGGTQTSQRVARDSGNNRAKNDSTSTVVAGIGAFPASHPAVQRRSLNVTHPGGGSYTDVLQIDVRGKDLHAPTGANAKCYRLEVTLRTGVPDAYHRVYSVVNGVSTLLAEKLQTLSLGTATKYDIAVENRNGATPLDGIPHITIRRAGSVLTSWTLFGVSGISQLSTGEIVDTRSSAVLTGWEQAWRFSASSGTSNRAYFDDWEDLAVLPETSLDDRPNVTVSDERDGVTGTLDVPLSWPVEVVRSEGSLRHEYDSDHAQTLTLTSRDRRTWRVSMKNAKRSEVDALVAFYDSHRCDVPFNWTVDGEAVVGVFLTPDLTDVLRGRGVGGERLDYDFEVQERLAP